MEIYPAKKAYQSKKEALLYDKKRFFNPKGRWVDKIEKQALRKALCHCSLKRESLILDLACGTGRISKMLINNGFLVVGADYSMEMLSVAKERLKIFSGLIGLCRMDAEHIGFLENIFDCIVSIRFMGHIPPNIRINMLKEMKEVTQKWLILAYYHKFCLHTLYRKIRHKFKKELTEGYPVSFSNLLLEIKSANLKIIKIFPTLKFIHQAWIILLSK